MTPHAKPAKVKRKKAQKDPKTDGDDQKEEEEEEGHPVTPEHKIRNRKVKVRDKDDVDKMKIAIRLYLGSIGVTWTSVQQYHSTNPVRPDDAQCKKFKELQERLLEDKPPECLTCLAFLRSKDFEADTCKEYMNMAITEAFSPFIARFHSVLDDLTADLENFQKPEGLDQPTADGQEEGPKPEQDEASASEWQKIERLLAKMKVLQLLPYGTEQKRVPIRCLICKSKGQPRGQIFEADKLRFNSIKRFVDQHCQGPNHIDSLNRLVAERKRQASKSSQGSDADAADSQQAEQQRSPCLGISLTHGPQKFSQWRSGLSKDVVLCKIME